ncbi:MAG: hypothetical protein K2I42_05560 [Anaeroplasmataceae bacterium]|nr:hypothetical protein [Anaeroplasmataceae bacterium]
MAVLKKELKKYYNSIRKNLACSFNMKSVFISEFNSRVYDYLEENPNQTIENVIEYFGSPEEIAKSFDKDNEYYKSKARNRLILEIILITLLIVSILVSCFVICNILSTLGGDSTITTK